jgi:hypothetical protein
MGGRVETGDIKTKVMIMEGLGDNLSWPIFNAGYAEKIENALGQGKANQMMRFYLQDNGFHAVGGGWPTIFNQALTDMMAWVEQGIQPPPSTQYTISNGQVIPAPQAPNRKGLQPVINLTANGGSRAVVGVNQPVNLVAKLQMPPSAGKITQFNWTVGATNEAPTILADPQPLVNLTRTLTFATAGTYVVTLNVNGQRDGLVAPFNQTLLPNFKIVQVVVQ